MSERLNGVETRRPPGRIEAKADAHRRGTADRPDECVGPDQGTPPGDHRDAVCAKQPEPEPTPTTEQGYRDRFRQKLGKDIALAGAYGSAQADLSRTLGHGHEHDIHNANAAHQ